MKETLVPSKLRNTIKDNSTDNVVNTESDGMISPSTSIDEEGCYHCTSACKACRLFISVSKTARSFHADYTVNIRGRLDCNTPGVCYLINDKVCRRSSVGSTINKFKIRWQNHKSHIRNNARSCEIAKKNNSEFHELTKDPLEILDLELSKQLEVIIFEKLDFTNCTSQDDKIKVAKERETFWQHQLMTLECYGRLNKRVATFEIKT